MKKILCFGDSNTYGFIPETKRRYDINTRWTGMLQNTLGSQYVVVEAGCNNRTAFRTNPYGEEYSGYAILPKYLDSTFEIVILALGANDVQKTYDTEIEDVENGVSELVDLTRELCPKCQIILVAPAKFGNEVLTNSFFSKLFDKSSIEKSEKFSEVYKAIAEQKQCKFIDWSEITEVSPVDGLHFSVEGHQKIAIAMTKVINSIY